MNNLEKTYLVDLGHNKNLKINIDSWADQLGQLKTFPYSLRLFENLFSDGLELIKYSNIKTEKPKGLLFSIYAPRTPENFFEVFYNKLWDVDYLYIGIKEDDYFKGVGLTRQRGNLNFKNYKNNIDEKSNFKEELLNNLFGEKHPYSVFEINENNDLLWSYTYADEKMQSE